MIAFSFVLAEVARGVGMKVPKDVEAAFSKREFPHWLVYCCVQLCAPMPHPSAHWDNAKLIASISENDILTITYEQLIERGLAIGDSSISA